MLVAELIRRKRNGQPLEGAALAAFVTGLVDGTVGDAQAAAFAMAVCWRGLDDAECAALTDAMARSGETMTWADAGLDGPVIDKHSTGGIGDLVSLILAPAVAACGAYVPMIAGRGLGHTGGTVDKLDSIPGYDTAPDSAVFKAVVKACGCAIIGQTAALAPADRRLYAIRDVTATVESIPLIMASILAKKLAAGLDGLVMDVKTGSGAFLPNPAEAADLAQRLVDVGRAAGLPVAAILTDMSEPLAPAAGNALEVQAALDHLTGRAIDPRVEAVVRALGAAMLRLVGLAATTQDGIRAIDAALSSGRAAECFARMVAALGGPHTILADASSILPAAPIVRPIPAPKDGIVVSIDTRAVGLAVVALGGGRRQAGDPIDPRVGLTAFARIGDRRGRGEPLAFVHAPNEGAAARAIAAVQSAYALGLAAAPPTPLVGLRFGTDA